jgi:uncharacterized protein YkwD
MRRQQKTTRFSAISCRRFVLPLCLLFCLLLLNLTGCGTVLADLIYNDSELEAKARKVFDLTNEERAKAGLSTLTWNDQLAQSAADHCQDMIDRDYFAHQSPDGLGPGNRATAVGYKWAWIGENLAVGYYTSSHVMEGWMNSEDHKENILRPVFMELGVAVRVSDEGRVYWAQEFGTPLSAYTHLDSSADSTDTGSGSE